MDGQLGGPHRDSSPRPENNVNGDFAFVQCFLELKGTKKGPEGEVHFWMRETMAFERIRGVWRIVHEHASVPFYMDGTFRLAFDLPPRRERS
jgi:ketosteroid isomerase-like protein